MLQVPSPWEDCLLARESSGKELEELVVVGEHLTLEDVGRKWLEIG